MVDGKTSASVVAVDAASAATIRDAQAREVLRSKHGTLQIVSGIALTVPYTLKVIADSVDRAEVDKILADCFATCDRHLNEHNPESEVSRLNAAEKGTTMVLSPALTEVLTVCREVFAASRGVFDPACAPICLHWFKAIRETGEPPRPDDPVTKALQTASSFTNFDLNTAKRTITKRHTDARLFLSTISKGWTVDLIIDELNRHNYNDILFEWGGEFKATGRNEEGIFWTVGVQRPPERAEVLQNGAGGQADKHAPMKLIAALTLKNEAVATAGDYMQLQGKTTYSHLYSTKRNSLVGISDTELAQVTIKCSSCMLCDALSTAALLHFVFRDARLFIEKFRYGRHRVTDYVLYSRNEEAMSRMLHNECMGAVREARSTSFPARVVVVGGGLAGMCAAIEAYKRGASVVLLEKEGSLGGNSAKATSGINGWGTRAQGRRGISDNDKLFERDTHKSGKGGKTSTALVRTLSMKSSEAIEWLTDEFNLPLSIVSQLGGHSRPRTHRCPEDQAGNPVPVGFTIVNALIKYVQTMCADGIHLMPNTKVNSLISATTTDPDGSARVRINGVRYHGKTGIETELNADAVILTSGGFGCDDELLGEYNPGLVGTPTTNGGFTTGDGMKMARKIGAHLIDMPNVQLHPTGLIDPKNPQNKTKFLGPEALRGSGGILINKKGVRFVNELDLRSVVSKAIQHNGDIYPNSGEAPFAHCVLNREAMTLFGPKFLNFYKDRIGLFKDAKDVAELASIVGCEESVLRQTLETYAESSKQGYCPMTEKTVFPCPWSSEGPFVVAYVTPSIHYCMGGISITPSAEVTMDLGEHGTVFGTKRPIVGLFAAGEVTGGVHGKNRLGGNSLLECVVFGRIAGERASTILHKAPTGLSNEWTSVSLREIRDKEQTFGPGTKVFRFNLPSVAQRGGLKIGHFIAIQGEFDGRHLVGYYSPVTRPEDIGVVGILARTDKGTLSEWLNSLAVGDCVQMRVCGGITLHIERDYSLSFNKRPIRKIGMIAGGTGIAPMVQIMRAATREPVASNVDKLNLIFAAERESDLTFRDAIESTRAAFGPQRFNTHYILTQPPQGWTEGVGFVDRMALRNHLAPASGASDMLIIICGPPIMQNAVKKDLAALGYPPEVVHTVDEEPLTQSKV